MIMNIIKPIAKLIIVLTMMIAMLPAVNAQNPSVINQTPPPQQYPWVKDHINKRKPITYVHEREADIMWSKRIWRTIDLREKINLPLYYPDNEEVIDRKSLWKVIKMGLLSGEITAYDQPAFDDEFQLELTLNQVKGKIATMDTVYTQDSLGNMTMKTVPKEIMTENIKRYWIKEDWFFDKQRSVMDVRIIGICPLKEKIDMNTGDFRGYEPLFWLYFPQCRPMFGRYEIFNRHNDSERRTFDDIFHKRLFSSFVHKESNVYDRYIVQYTGQMGCLLESDRIKDELFVMEHDMWHY